MGYAEEIVTLKIIELKHKIKILQQLSELSGRGFDDETNELLDQLNWWLKIEKELKKKN